jgi:hypothetical protein
MSASGASIDTLLVSRELTAATELALAASANSALNWTTALSMAFESTAAGAALLQLPADSGERLRVFVNGSKAEFHWR